MSSKRGCANNFPARQQPLSKRKSNAEAETVFLCCYQWDCARAQSFVGWDPGGWNKKRTLLIRSPRNRQTVKLYLKRFITKLQKDFNSYSHTALYSRFQRDILSVRQFGRRLKIQYPWASGVQIQNTLQLRMKTEEESQVILWIWMRFKATDFADRWLFCRPKAEQLSADNSKKTHFFSYSLVYNRARTQFCLLISI